MAMVSLCTIFAFLITEPVRTSRRGAPLHGCARGVAVSTRSQWFEAAGGSRLLLSYGFFGGSLRLLVVWRHDGYGGKVILGQGFVVVRLVLF